MSSLFTNREYTDMIRTLVESGDSVLRAQRTYRERFPNRRIPSRTTILAAYQHLLDYGQFRVPNHAQGRGRHRHSYIRLSRR